jgi:hypothetical protein
MRAPTMAATPHATADDVIDCEEDDDEEDGEGELTGAEFGPNGIARSFALNPTVNLPP